MTRISLAIRQKVRERAGGRCEYCRRLDDVAPLMFQVDHIIPVKQGGPSSLDNLAYACILCNQAKGTDVAVYDLNTAQLTPLFNPRTQKWDDHFELDGEVIFGKTPVGRATIRILRFNRPEQVAVRRLLIQLGLW